MKWTKRAASLLLGGAMLFSLAACGGGKEPTIEYGRYVEIEVTPPGMQGDVLDVLCDDTGLYDVLSIDNGTYSNGYRSSYFRYRSTDYGATWAEVDMSWTEPYIAESRWMQEDPVYPEQETTLGWTLCLLDGGDLLASLYTYYYNGDEMDYMATEMELVRVSLDGQISPMELEGTEAMNQPYSTSDLGNIAYLGQNRMFVEIYINEYNEKGEYQDWHQLRCLYDTQTGKQVAELSGFDGWLAYYGNGMFVMEDYNGKARAMDIATGEPVADAPFPPYYEYDWNGYYPSWGNSFIDDDNSLVVFNAKGMTRFRFEQDPEAEEPVEPELIMEGLNYAFGSPLRYANVMRRVGDEFLATMGMRGTNQTVLMRYVWDDEAIAKTDNHISVFSLYDSETVRLALSEYRMAHPEVTVSFDYALERYNNETSTLTKDDVLRNLSTDLLTGNGPDILILDDMPVQSYIDQGILEDISAVVAQTDIFPQLVSAFGSGDALYAVPARFSVPMLFGEVGHVESFASFDTLVNAILEGPGIQRYEWNWETMNDDDYREYDRLMNQPTPLEERPMFYYGTLEEMLSSFYETSAPAIFGGQTGLDREALTRYLQAVGQISEHYELNQQEDDYYYGNDIIAMGGLLYGWGSNFNQFTEQRARLGYIHASSFDPWRSISYFEYYARDRYYGEDDEGNPIVPDTPMVAMDATGIPAPGLSTGVYTPRVITGLCENSQNKEVAMDFLVSLLGPVVQGYDMYEGLPVTRSGNEAFYAAYLERDDWMVEENVSTQPFDYEGLYGDLQTAYIPNSYLFEIVMDYAVDYCMGKITLDQAVSQIAGETEMYFAERQ